MLGSYLTRFESQASPVEVAATSTADIDADAERDFDETRINPQSYFDDEDRLNYLSTLKPFKAEYVAALHGIYLDTAGYCEEEILPAVDWAEMMAPMYVTDHSTTAYRKNADGTFTEDAAAYERLREVESKMFRFSHPELDNVQADADELKPDYDEKRWAVDFDIYHADSDLTDAQLQDFTNRLHEAMTANGNRASVELEDCVIGIYGDNGGDNDSVDKIITARINVAKSFFMLPNLRKNFSARYTNNSGSCGMYVTNSNTIKQAIISGMTAIDMSFSETFAIPHPTNKFMPTGGVTSPIDKFKTMTAPK